MKRVLVLAVLVMGTTGTAQAAPFAGPEYVALHIADAYWGGRPPQCLPLSTEVESGAQLQAEHPNSLEVLGYATFPDVGFTRFTPCRLQIREGLSWEVLCAVMVHEVGHLWYYEHSSDPTNIMYPDVPVGTIPGCVVGIDPGPSPPLRKKRHRRR